MVLHLPVHLKSMHEHEPDVQALLERNDKNKFDEIKRKGNNKHNKTVLKAGIGELILSRRPVAEFQAKNYGTCPHCLEWMNLETIRRHQSKCKSRMNSAAIASANCSN